MSSTEKYLLKISAFLLLAFGFATTMSTAFGNLTSGLILLTALLVFFLKRLHPDHLPPKDVMWALLALFVTHMAAAVLSAPASIHWSKIYEEYWFKLLLLTVPILAAGRPRLVINAVLLLIAAGVLSGVYAGYQYVTGNDLVRHTTLHSTVGYYIATGFHSHHLSFGGQIMFALVMAMAWLRHILINNPRRLWLPFIACVIIGMGLVWSFARSAQLGAFAAMIMMVISLPRKWRVPGVGMLVVLVLVAAAMPQVRNRVIEGFTDEKEVTRVNLWRSSVAGIADRPLRGWGQGNFGEMLKKHEFPGFYESRAHSHNDFLMEAVTAGIPGLLAALWLLWATIRHLNSGWRRNGSGSWVILGALGCQIAVIVAGLFQVYQTDDEPEMMLYFLVGCGLALLLGNESKSEEMQAD